MCTRVRIIGLCGHELYNRGRYEPKEPSRCAYATLLSIRNGKTAALAARCKPYNEVKERPKAVCWLEKCWIDYMLQQTDVGWLCCKCSTHMKEKGCKKCTEEACQHPACPKCGLQPKSGH
ncbi:hypothetical protein ISF_02565 [Cordyceps fumosorosea ARSEF 2679]|uniref:Uncharacterized protein n=1 Tax=Cordyceps fumosorosea (strain ARSEF 2679) TaxID=1081104 RepID=A0A168BVC1_CORFA|nr:hypothetical protein ISF_02565 [Cordyceps fumosorosea ARSEF 2679]OAA70591.1 hypothetical protein ISF_02565 [Cordyceps fumosorosea ARSEF 2679]